MYFGEHDFQLKKIVKYKIKLGQNLFLWNLNWKYHYRFLTFLFKNMYFFDIHINITLKYMMWKQIDIKGE